MPRLETKFETPDIPDEDDDDLDDNTPESERKVYNIRRRDIERLARETNESPTDVDRDYDWAWRNMGRIGLRAKSAPSVPAFQLYLFAREDKKSFVQAYNKQIDSQAKREMTNREIEDDKEDKLDALDKIQEAVEMDVEALLVDALRLHPERADTALQKLGYSRVGQ